MASGRTIWKQAQRTLEDLSLAALVTIPVLLVAAGARVAAFAGLLLAVLFVPLLVAASLAESCPRWGRTRRAPILPLNGRWLGYLLALLLLVLLYAMGIPLLLRFTPTRP
jgi:hypothetical protein